MNADMYIGVGIAFGSACFAGAQVAMTSIKARSSAKIADPDRLVFRDTCDARHAGIVTELKNINDTLQTVLKAVSK